MKEFLQDYIEDLLILGGLTILVGTTFFVSIIAGFYASGVTMCGLGAYFARFPPREVRKSAIQTKRKGSGAD